MANLKEWNNWIQSLDVIKAFNEYVNDNPTIFIDALKEQLSEGKSGNGFITPAYRSIAYSKEKNNRNPKPPAGTPDLYDEGDFYRGIKFDTSFSTTEVDIKFYSTDSKNDMLTEKYDYIWVFNKETILKLKPDLQFNLKGYLL